MHFRIKDDSGMKEPEVIALRFATDYFMAVSWEEQGIKIHVAKDILIEAWILDQVRFVSNEEWEELMKKVEVEKEKASSYVV